MRMESDGTQMPVKQGDVVDVTTRSGDLILNVAVFGFRSGEGGTLALLDGDRRYYPWRLTVHSQRGATA